jgi:hypothetical protein
MILRIYMNFELSDMVRVWLTWTNTVLCAQLLPELAPDLITALTNL